MQFEMVRLQLRKNCSEFVFLNEPTSLNIMKMYNHSKFGKKMEPLLEYSM